MKRSAASIVVISSLLVLGFAVDAFSQLTAVGPIDPLNGFPQWYQDRPVRPGRPGTRLRLCLTEPICEHDRVIPRNPFSRRIGFGHNAFYWEATAEISTRINPRFAKLEMGVMANWRDGVPRRGRRVINFIRIDLRQAPYALYTVIHPFGQETIDLRPAGANGVRVRSVGGRNFSAALRGPVTRFLRGSNPPPGFIGDWSALGRITGSPRGANFFRVIAVSPPGINLGGNIRPNVVQTTRFQVQGRLAR
jgi:hypothetical protein